MVGQPKAIQKTGFEELAGLVTTSRLMWIVLYRYRHSCVSYSETMT